MKPFFPHLTPEQKAENLKLITDELDKRIEVGEFDAGHLKAEGIRSRQVLALITLLVERGVL